MEIKENFNLRNHNTFHIPAIARRFGEFSNQDELEAMLTGFASGPVFILGGGSNVLFADKLDGLVLKNSIKQIQIVKETEDEVEIMAGAGEVWHELVAFCVANKFGGIENLSLIPGSVGASPIQNIGAYGVELKEVFAQLQAFHLKEKYIRTFNADECEFGYRDSVFKRRWKNQYVILNVTLRLRKKPVFHVSYGALEKHLRDSGVTELSVKAISDAVIAIRRSKLPDPAVLPNAGSFFKNPVVPPEVFYETIREYPDVPHFKSGDGVKIPAAWLIERCGFKGYRQGDVGCHVNQPLVIVNYGNATGEEILFFSEKIIADVQRRFNIIIEREVNVVL